MRSVRALSTLSHRHGECIAPMLAMPGAMPDDPAGYSFEVKWDGYRALARRDGRRVVLCSRNGLDLLPVFPELGGLSTVIEPSGMLDGEIVALDDAGRSGFSALQTRLPGVGGTSSTKRWDAARWRIVYVVFDLLRHRGRSLMALPWVERRQRLDALGLSDAHCSCPPFHDDGGELLAAVQRLGGEGIIAKRRLSTYQAGRRSRDWLKIKLTRREEFVVGGYWQGGQHPVLGSLLLGYFPDRRAARAGRLRYVGKVGSGFDESERQGLRQRLEGLAVAASPFDRRIAASGVRWCRPHLVVEVGYAEWTHEGSLRQARYAGLRHDKAAVDVIRADPLIAENHP